MANDKIESEGSQDLKKLIRNRGTIKQRLSVVEKFIYKIKTTFTDDNKPNLNDVELRFKNSSTLLQDFENIQSIIESLCEENDLESHFKEGEEFQERYYLIQDFLSTYIKNEKKDSDNVSNVTQPITPVNNFTNSRNNFDSLQNVLLPKLKLPTFSGNFEQWLNFKLSFISIIDSNCNLTDLQKFQFLKASLEGYASRFVEGLEGVEKPYEQSWYNLCNKFDKKQFLLDTHFQQLLNVSQLNKENFHSFNIMLDQITKHITAIESMKLNSKILYDSLVIHLLSGKFDKVSLREWKELEYDGDLPTLDEFQEFIKNKADLLQSLEQSYTVKPVQTMNKQPYQNRNSNNSQLNLSVNNSEPYSVKCNFCKKNHTIYKCQEFLALSVKERMNSVKRLNLCQNCLRTGHSHDHCTFFPCKICKVNNKVLKHNTLLHITSPNRDQMQQNSQNMLIRPTVKCESQVLLSTIVCKVKDSEGNYHDCRALLDCGAQSNLITEKFCKKLNLHCTQTNLSIMGINQIVSQLNKKCNLSLFSNSSNFNCTIDCFVSPIITSNIPSCHISNIDNWNIPKHIILSDPTFFISRGIDLLIGASLFWDLILDGKIKLSDNLPSLQNTQFGYIVTGILPFSVSKNSTSICNFSKVHIPEDDQLKRFWELEEVKMTLPLTKGDLECEKQFENDTFRNEQGQFVVKFPLKHSPSMLGNSKEIASKRFLSLERKFVDPNFKKLYFDFIHEYESLGHMTKVLDSVSNNSNNISYFLPHHGVLKEESITTKLRTVFDGSCPSSSGWSLNDIQYVGPKVQNDIIDIILRFRIHKYVVSADISKMYRCILMNSEHRPLQQILWRETPNDKLSVYQLNTVSYGTRSAPYLAIKCLKDLANQHNENYPEACQIIHNDFYVDDLLTGSNDLTELKTRCKEIYSILESGHFILRKWVSNDAQVISDISHSYISNSVLDLGKNESCKTLGIQWVPVSDNLKYNIKKCSLDNKNPVTKRNILSIIAQIYDPLNLLSPTIITFKLIIQKLWSLRIPWDSSVPSDLEQLFIKMLKGLPCLNDLYIPRTVIPEGFNLVDVHCFCDASKDAYACSIYVRSKDIQDNIHVHLLCAKSKVAPLKTITIPKLELCASLLGCQLIELVTNSLSLSVPIIMWSDSQVTLSWIGTEPSLLQVFVANRVAKIQSFSNLHDWRYVNTKNNPADLATRGISPECLLNSSLWWTGPPFLKTDTSDWPDNNNYSIPFNQLPELKKKVVILQTTINENHYIFMKFSSLLKLRRVTALCIRFFNNLKNKKNKLDLQTGHISVSELNDANESLIKLAQKESFNSELNLLNKNGNLNKKHKLSSLAPFIDTKGIMRVGGRLKNTYLSYEVKHPVLLYSNHPFTKLIFDYKHKQLLHPGPQLLLASIRQFYWPVGGLNLAKKTVKNCILCFKFNPTPASCPMASLPDNRIKPSLPFKITGIDYAGPFFILNKPGKGAKLVKCYLAVFICFCTKAVHLEIVSCLTTESFLACLKRFTSRRGLPSQIFSDNGSTFIGASNELRDLGKFLQTNQGYIIDSTSQDNIHWVFIPPYTPNFGGLWEAAVKSAKHHLKRALINHNVTFEEFNTLVIQVEGILNSRPLFSMSNDPNDLSPITPSHFLIGRPLNSVPEVDLTQSKFNRLSRIQHVQKLCQQFWSQFSKHYISELHSQYKWKENPTKVDNGALVLLRNEKQPSYRWCLGRVIQQFPSKDGVSRVAEILTQKGKICRSIRHLCPLPLQEEIEN